MSGMKNLDLREDEAAALIRVLRKVIDDDRYPLSSRVQMLQGILDRLEPRAARPSAAPEPRVYEPPLGVRHRRRE
jgi:hypothetical protein